jgi:hypothetical protein
MKILYYPHKGEHRAGEGERWKAGLRVQIINETLQRIEK